MSDQLIAGDEIAKLKASPDFAALGDKLEKLSKDIADGKMIPNSRLSEEIEKKKQAETRAKELEALSAKNAEEQKAKEAELLKSLDGEKKQREELQAKYDEEKKVADASRARVASKREAAKKLMGDAYLPEYETFSEDSLDKVVAGFSHRDNPGGGRPGASTEKKTWAQMTNEEREAEIEGVKAGRLK